MEITVPRDAQAATIFTLVKNAQPGVTISCHSERQFALARIALVKLQKVALTIQHVDDSGYTLKQAVSRDRSEVETSPEELNSDQLRALSALERALQQCSRHGVTVVGFSDSLVGVPAPLGHDMSAISSAAALELNTYDAYKGIDTDQEF